MSYPDEPRIPAPKGAGSCQLNKQGHLPHPNSISKLFFQCELLSGSPAASIETEEVGFFAEDNIPQLSLGRVMPAQITRLFQHYRYPDLPTDFD